jgi:NAD(P)-dependent dehydrogenase (short-subunit alcohol dehydrogenase family)
MKVNARAPFCFLTAAVPHLKKANDPVAGGSSGASVVNVSSVNGIQSFAGCVSYCSSKAAIDMMTRCVTSLQRAWGVHERSPTCVWSRPQSLMQQADPPQLLPRALHRFSINASFCVGCSG